MTLRPITFKESMVRAILEGRKRQTRRLVSTRTSRIGSLLMRDWDKLDFSDAFVDPGGTLWGPGPYLKVSRPDDESRHRVYSRVEVGDTLWVKENFHRLPDGGVSYAADGAVPGAKKLAAMFLSQKESRLSLHVTKLRAERLQDITNDDARQEGVREYDGDEPGDYRGAFRELWDRINGKRCPWESNPWIWVYDFEVMKP
jgi:hypothetical protein